MSATGRHRAVLGERDANHNEIASLYEAHMCLTFDTHAVGLGFGDIVVRIPTRRGSVLQIVEIKTDEGRLSGSQERFVGEWGVACVAQVRTPEDVRNHVRDVQERNR